MKPTDGSDAQLAAFAERVAAHGLDLTHAFDARWYNDAISGHGSLRPLELFGRVTAHALLIGNSRALWPHIVAALAREPALRESENPIDDFAASVISEALVGLDTPYHLYLAHQRDQRLVSMLHVADASGLAGLSPMRLALHRELGPWFALRAVVVFDLPTPCERRPVELPCESCAKPCVPALERALASYRDHGEESVARSWETWLAVRDACPVGREHRYDDAQLHYHYTKDLVRLRALAAHSEPALHRPRKLVP